MPRRRKNRSTGVRFASALGGGALRMCAAATHRPIDSMAILAAAAASLIIVVNALFLQSGAHPPQFFAVPSPATASENRPASPQPPQAAAARSNDPIADLIGPSPRILAVQRTLSEYGYGQIKLNGILDQPTIAAIDKFQRERGLPVTGEVSERLVNELMAMTGHPLQ